jgi:hypothetical protein
MALMLARWAAAFHCIGLPTWRILRNADCSCTFL